MRFIFPEINNVFEFNGDYINTLVIENRKFLLRVVKDIFLSISGNDGLTVLSKNYKPISLQKNCELISDFVNFDINSKSLIAKILSALEKVSLNEENYLKTQSFLTEIDNYISHLSFGFPCDIVSTKMSAATLIKAAGIGIRDDYNSPLGDVEKILDYMELVREFDREKLFITLNMRSFFDDDIVGEFIKTAISHEYKVLMIESSSYLLLEKEKRITIDNDLCEF